MYRVNRQTISKTGNTKIKLQAIEKEYSWYQNFLKDCSPESLADKETLKIIKKQLDKVFIKKRAQAISSEVRTLPQLFFWSLKNIGNVGRKVLGVVAIECLKSNGKK